MSKEAQSKWDIVRFFTTLNTFGELPFLGSFRWVQEWMGQRKPIPGADIGIDIGADIKTMDKQVVVIGPIPSKAVTALEQTLPLIKLSSYKWNTRTDSLSLEEKHTLCKLTKHADTVLVWQDPNFSTLDFSNLVTTLDNCLGKNSEVTVQTVFDFTQPEADLSAWGTLDDVVMGGVSQGAFLRSSEETIPSALFVGNVSTNNSGGFSSVRTQNFEPPYRFTGWTGLQLKVKGDGQRYKFILRNTAGWDSPAYIYGFDTVADEWTDVTVPFEEMIPTFRAKSMPSAPAFNPACTVSFQLMLSKFEYDGRLNPTFSAGPFKLAIASISAYRTRQGVPLVVLGATEETARQAQQTVLTETGIRYRFIEPSQPNMAEADLVEAVSKALS
ncbi:MAG: CIA30 family protein [Cyanobacteria bacterium J06621_11]